VKHGPARPVERAYVLDVLLHEFLGLDYEVQIHEGPNTCITLLGDERQRQLEMPDVLLASPEHHWLHEASLPAEPLAVWHTPSELLCRNSKLSLSVPVIYGRPTQGRMFDRWDGGIYIGIDVFGSALFMLARYEELVCTARDRFGRFPASASVAFREGFLERPIVNEYVQILWAAIKDLWPQLERRQRQYQVVLSHDVDVVSMHGRGFRNVLFSLGADLFSRRDPLLAVRRLRAYRRTFRDERTLTGDPYDTFDFIMETSERSGIRSVFNFIPGRSDPAFDAVYDVGDPVIRSLIRRIHSRGHQIGFHPSFNTYRDGARTKAEFARLRQVCDEEGVSQANWGGRQHYLRWENPITWENWEDCGLDYDSSLTYPERAGFRSGSCHEHPVIDLRRKTRLRLRERPLVVMEGSLLSYLSFSLEEAEEKICDLIDTCRRYDGDFTLLWHNHMLVSRRARQTYSRIVAMAAGLCREFRPPQKGSGDQHKPCRTQIAHVE